MSRRDRGRGVLDRKGPQAPRRISRSRTSSAIAARPSAAARRRSRSRPSARRLGGIVGRRARRAGRGGPPRAAWSVRAPPPPAGARVRARDRRAFRRAGSGPRRRRASPGMAASALIRSRRAALLRRQESLEKEPVGRQAGDAERGERRGGAGRGGHREARSDGLGDQLVAGIGNQRRAGVGNQRQRLPRRRCARRRARPHFGGVVLVVRRKRRLDAVTREQACAKRGCPRRELHRRRPGSTSARSVTSARLPIGVATT